MASNGPLVPYGYTQFLDELKEQVRSSRARVRRVVSTSLIDLYRKIGHRILDEQERQG